MKLNERLCLIVDNGKPKQVTRSGKLFKIPNIPVNQTINVMRLDGLKVLTLKYLKHGLIHDGAVSNVRQAPRTK